jgi:hypothetical protein
MSNLAESSKEGRASKRAVLPMMIYILIIVVMKTTSICKWNTQLTRYILIGWCRCNATGLYSGGALFKSRHVSSSRLRYEFEQATTASFQILSNSPYNSYPSIRSNVVSILKASIRIPRNHTKLIFKICSFFLFCFWGGVRLSPLGTSATNWPTVPAPGDRWWWVWSSRWNEMWQGKPKY